MEHDRSTPQNRVAIAVAAAIALSTMVLCLSPTTAKAYDRYSQNRDATNCRACHGDFRAASYVSLVDGTNWGNLHNLHRSTMLNNDCSVCHLSSSFPVLTYQSSGGTGLAALSCVGCHGRDGDNTAQNPDYPHGYGAGLRRHHYTKGVAVCADCHADASPANFTPVAESVLPNYYANPGTNHPLMPKESCNGDGSENFAGLPIGLDNDGNDLYDQLDPQCGAAGVGDPAAPFAAGGDQVRGCPNPSTGSISVEYRVSGSSPVEIRVFDVNGRLVRDLGSSKPSASKQRVEWDGRDTAGREMPSGVYICDIRSTEAHSTMAMRLLR